MSFTITELTGHKYLVDGTDVRGFGGQQIIDSTEHDLLIERDRLNKAHDVFDSKVEDFFAELTEAVDELNKAHTQVEIDPLLYIVEQEGTEGVEAQQQVVRQLNPDTVILRAIIGGHQDRLIWVNNELVLTKTPVVVQAPVFAEPEELDFGYPAPVVVGPGEQLDFGTVDDEAAGYAEPAYEAEHRAAEDAESEGYSSGETPAF